MINDAPRTTNNCVVACECEYARQTLPPASSWQCLWLSSSFAAPALWEAQKHTKQTSTITHWGSLWRLSTMWKSVKETLIVLTTPIAKMSLFFFFFCSTQGRELPFSSCTWSFTIKPFFIHTKRDVKMFYYCGKVRCWLSVTLKWEVIRTGGVLTLLSALEYMGWWSVCGWPCRPAGVPRWRRRQHWAEADLLGGLETGMSDWHVPTCIETPAQIYIHIRQLWSEIRTDRRTRSYFGLASTWSWVWLPEGPRRWQWLTGHCVGWSSSLLHIPPQYQTSLSWKKWTQTLRVRQQQTQPGD